MELYPDTLQKARDQGLSDDEIKTHLSADKRFSTAFERGLSLEDIATHFDQKLKAQPVQVQYDTQPPTENDLAVSREAAGASVPTTFEKIKKAALGSLIPEHKIKEYSEKARQSQLSPGSVGEAINQVASLGTSAIEDAVFGREKAQKVRGEVASKVTQLGASFISPVGIATLGIGALPSIIQKAIGVGFAADIMSHAPEQADAILKAKTPEEKTAAIFDAATSAAMVGGIAGHLGGRPSVGGEILKGEAGLERTKEFQDKLTKVTNRQVDSTLSEVAQAEPPTFTKLTDIPPSAETQPGGAVPPTTAEVGALPAELKGGEPNATQERVQPESDQLQYQGTDALRKEAEAGNRNRDARSGEIPNEAQVTPATPDWLKQDLTRLSAEAERRGIVDQIEELSAQRLTAKQVANRLGLKSDEVDIVRAVKAERGIPSMDDVTAYEQWVKSRATAEPTTARTGTEPTPPLANTPTEGAVVGEGPASVQPTGKLSAAQLNEKIDALLSRHQAEKDPAVQSQLFAEAKGLMDQLKTAEGESMGPGAASAEEDLGRRIVSMKNAAIDQARQERGLEPLMSEAKRTFGESWDMAQEVIAKDEAAPAKLVDDLNSGKKTSINEVEQDLLLHEEIKLRNDRDMELERASDEFATAEERDAAAARITALEDRLNQTEQANRKAGTYSGRALSIRRQMMYDDYTPAALERRLRVATNGFEGFTDKEIVDALNKTKEDSAKITEALRKSEERVAQLEKEARDKAAEDALKQDLGEASIDQRVLDYSRKIVRKWENEAKPAMDRLRQRYAVLRITPPEPNLASDLRDLTLVARAFIGKNGLKAAEFSAEMIKEFGNAIEPLIDEAWKAANEQLNKLGKELPPRKKKAVVKTVKGQAGTDAERQAIISGITEAAKEGPLTDQATEKYVKLLFRNFIDSGMRGLDKITDAVHAIIDPNVPGITKDQIRDAYSDYGKTKAAPTEPNKVYASQLRGEAQKVSQLKDILEKQQAPKPTGQQRVPPADVTRRLQKLINEAKKKYNIQPADPAKALKSALDSRKTYYRNKLSDLRYEIAKQEKLVRDKVSPPTDPELEAIKKEYEQVKAEHDEIFGKPELTDQQKLERAIKVAERAEQNARRTLEDARKGVFPSKKPAGPTSPQLEAIKARVEALRQEAKELREMSDSFKQEAEQKKIQATEKQIAELDRKLREGDLATKPKTAEATGRLAALQSERAALVKELSRQRRELIPKRSPDEIALQSYAARLAREQADLLDRLSRADAGDATAFERRKPQKLDISKDPEVVKRKAVVEQLKQDLLKKEHEYRMARRKAGERIKDAIIQTFHAGKNIVSAFDFSAPRQGAFAIAGHPVKGLKALIPMFKGWASEVKAREQEARIHNRPNALAGVDKMAKVEYTPLDETKFTKAEENARSVLDDWAQLPLNTGNAAKSIATAPVKLVSKGVRMSNRAFITFLNTIRADLLDSLLEANFKDRAPTQAELEAIGNFVNVATGRGKLNPKVASVASGFIWAPKLLTSRIQTLAGQPFYRGTARTRVIMAKEYARVLVSGYLLWKTSQLFTDKNEQDPRSSDFGKIKIGNIRIDPWGGFQQVSVLASRLATRETKSAKSGKITSLTEPKFGQPDVTDVLKNFIRTKLSPPVGTVIDLLNKKNVVGQKVGVKEAVQNLSIPLSFRDIYKIMKQEGLPTAVIIQILSTFGAGVAVYDDEEKVNRQ